MNNSIIPETMPIQGRVPPHHAPSNKKGFFFVVLFVIIFLGWIAHQIFFLSKAPETFLPNTLITIPLGATLDSIAEILQKQSIIRSPLLFKLFVQHYGKEKAVPAGLYLFKTPPSLTEVAGRMGVGNHGIETFKLTFPEGITTRKMESILNAQRFFEWDGQEFLRNTEGREGFLFPDTYFFYSVATSGPIILALEENFEKRTARFKEEALISGKNWRDIITMASILEGEAMTHEDRRIISGILWKRLAKKMRLQVDATFMYTIGKPSSALTVEDLANDSLYNTYRHDGLPPGPINNPGIDTIDAALHPVDSPYFFYLSDKEGLMHYAKTFTEHKLNKKKYLE